MWLLELWELSWGEDWSLSVLFETLTLICHFVWFSQLQLSLELLKQETVAPPPESKPLIIS